MKQFYCLLFLALMFIGCKEFNYGDSEVIGVVDSDVVLNSEKVFGFSFDALHDFVSAYHGSVTVSDIPSNVSKVRLIGYVEEDDGETSVSVLNECVVDGMSCVVLHYDISKCNLGLYVMFISSDGDTYKKVDDLGCVSYVVGGTRSLPEGLVLPEVELLLSSSEESYSSKRGWIDGELLYSMNDYKSQMMFVSDYSDAYKELFRAIIFSYFKNGRKYNNLQLIKDSNFFNEGSYPFTTGDDPIIISPVYKNDGGYQEVINSDLYYYYFKDDDIVGDPVEYIESLPKYKAIVFEDCIKGDDVISKHVSYALVYWGDGIPEVGKTKGSYYFPKGYKIGFMIRCRTSAEGGKKQGELYGDGRLNNYINGYDKCNFKSSKLGVDGPRMGWFTLNGRMLLCWESGTDTDFNDIILEVEGGVEPIISVPDIDYNYYTFCFEDRVLGDYDMNDVVIKARRLNETQVEYSVIACGGTDDVYVHNINGSKINSVTELHSLFGTSMRIINVTKGVSLPYVSDVVTVPKSFSFLDSSTQPYIVNETKGNVVMLSRQGEDPHGIMLPCDFRYPLEGVCIKMAYPKFSTWGKNRIEATDWFKYFDEYLVY